VRKCFAVLLIIFCIPLTADATLLTHQFKKNQIAFQSPVITSPLTAGGTVGAPLSYQITATQAPTSFNATPLPAGLSVNTGTGLISGTPTGAGTTNTTISAIGPGGTGTATLVFTINTLAPAFYVATTGSDSNAGTVGAPFATLGKCQTAMQGSGTKKTCYIRAGSYAPAGLSACNSRGNCAIGLTGSDNGETWSYYPPDGVDSADITGGSTASGNGLWAIFFTGGATNVTITGLSLHNFDFAAVQSGGGANLTVTNNLMFNGFGIVGDVSLSGAQNAASVQCYSCANLTVSNNVVHDIASFGISNSNGGTTGTVFSGNVLYNICTQIRDCGALYSQDLPQTATNQSMTNNYVLDGCTFSGCAPGTGGWGSAVYLDDCASNWTISGNVFTGNNGSNNLMIHGGHNNVWSDNLIDVAATGNEVIRFQSSSCATVTGNAFQNNLIISNGAGGGYNSTGGTVTVQNDAYWNYGSGSLSSSGDSSPLVENPLMACGTYTVGAGSSVLNAPVSFIALPTSWGPPGFTIPTTGTPRSTTVGCGVAANTFLNSMGVNIHIGQGYSEAAYEPEFTYTGIRNARDYSAQYATYVTLHNNTVSGTFPGVKMDILAGAPSTIVTEGTALANAGALLAAEGPNEPNNFPITYLGNPGGGNGTWVPVAQFQRDLYANVKGSALSAYPVFGVSEVGAETDNVGLQCLVLDSSCPGASSVTLMAANTKFMDYANSHNYVIGCATPSPNQAWTAEATDHQACSDGLYSNSVSTWRGGFAGYTLAGAQAVPRVTSETGWDTANASCPGGAGSAACLDYQGKVLLNVYLDAVKRGWAYTFVYEMVDGQGGGGSLGFYTSGNVAKPSGTYMHNMTTILQDTTNFSPWQLNYTIASEPITVHDLLLQKSNGTFYIAVWDEQTSTSTTDNITVTLRAAANVTEYDPTVGTSSVATFTGVTSVPLTLSDHPIFLKIN
jgi:hypothetical protein